MHRPVAAAVSLVFAVRLSAAAPPAAPAAAWKTIDLVSATCGSGAPGRITFQIPPGYVVRTSAKGLTAGCLWGTSKDLALVLGESEATFDRVGSGVFQARLTTTVEFDPASGKFSDEENLGSLFGRAGVGGASVARRTLGGVPAIVVTGRAPNGAPLFLLYLAILRSTGAEVLLVNFHAPVDPGASRPDLEIWRRFVASVRTSK
jgi:hypothetical protein